MNTGTRTEMGGIQMATKDMVDREDVEPKMIVTRSQQDVTQVALARGMTGLRRQVLTMSPGTLVAAKVIKA